MIFLKLGTCINSAVSTARDDSGQKQTFKRKQEEGGNKKKQ